MGMLKSSIPPQRRVGVHQLVLQQEGQDYVNNLLQLPGTMRRDVTQYTHPALAPEVVGGGKRGPTVALTLPQSLLAVELNSSGLFQKLDRGHQPGRVHQRR